AGPIVAATCATGSISRVPSACPPASPPKPAPSCWPPSSPTARRSPGGRRRNIEAEGSGLGIRTGQWRPTPWWPWPGRRSPASPARVRTALVERDPVCVVPGCGVESDLEIDHVRPVAEGGRSELANLCRLCRFHHYLKTHHRWRISRQGKRWLWEGPHGPPP